MKFFSIAADQLDAEAETHSVVYFVEPTMTCVEALGDVALHVFKLIRSQMLAFSMADNNVIIYISLSFWALMQPCGE